MNTTANTGTHGTIQVKKTRGDRIFQAIVVALMCLVLVITLYPLYFVVIASISDPQNVYNGYVTFLPSGFNLEGYKRIFQDMSFWLSYLNSIVYTVAGTLLAIFLSMTIAFPLSRKYFSGRNVVNIILLIPMYFSGGLIPTYLNMQSMNLVGSPLAVIILGAFSVFNVIVARTFLIGNLPQELDEAAYIEGCSYIRYFMQFVLPLSKAVIAVLVLYYGIAYWNDYFNAMIYLDDPKFYPLQLKLYDLLIDAELSASMFSSGDIGHATYMRNLSDSIKYGMIVISALPMMILYPFLQKYFVQGVMIGSLKG